MGRNDGVEVRRQRIQATIQKVLSLLHINKDKGEITLDKTIADWEFETGLTEKRILEYLEIGEKRGLFVVDRRNNKIKRTED
jgi:hypothetical protein